MSDTDKHEAIKDLRERMIRVEGAVSIIGTEVAKQVAAVSKEVSEFIHEIDRRALAAKEEESDWKMEHASAVANCNAKGEVAAEAKKIALAAKAIAENAYAASGGKAPSSDRISFWTAVGALITGLGSALLSIFGSGKQ